MNSVQELAAELRAGGMIILMDDEQRENEGDLVMAASCVEPQHINFMIREARGLVCLTLTGERCRQLDIAPMVADNRAHLGTNFGVSIDAAEGISTGISAADRCRTIRAAVAADARPQHLVRPGHIFPIIAHPGGVLARAGHTEAACQLAALAGRGPSAVIVEIINDDGSMARRPDLQRFAARHSLKMGTIADLIRHLKTAPGQAV